MIFIRFQAHFMRFDHQIAPQICPSGFPAVAGLESFLILLRKKRERTGNNKIRILHTKWTNLRNGKKVAKTPQKGAKKSKNFPKLPKISQFSRENSEKRRKFQIGTFSNFWLQNQESFKMRYLSPWASHRPQTPLKTFRILFSIILVPYILAEFF